LTYPHKMISPIYQEILQTQLTRAQYLLLQLVIGSLQMFKQMKLEALAESLSLPILLESRRKKLHRFLKLSVWSIEKLWFPCLKAWLGSAQGWVSQGVVYLAIDRTSWGSVNLLMVSLIVQHRGIPVYWIFLDKKGSSNLAEQQQVIRPVLAIFKEYKSVILGDREFCSVDLGKWLGEGGVYFCLRQKKSTNVTQENGMMVGMESLGLKPGMKLFLNDVQVTQKKDAKGFGLACKWKKTYRGFRTKEAWFILTNFDTIDLAIAAYQKRFSIEEMFRDYKSGGYNLEGTQMNQTHLSALLVIVAIAYTSACLQGQGVKAMGIQKYVARPENPHTNQRRHSRFYVGQHLYHWLDLSEMFRETIDELLQISRYHLPHYIRGRRAMALALSTF